MDVTPDGFEIISGLVGAGLGFECSVLMGANIANEIGLERCSEATVGYDPGAECTGALWKRVSNTECLLSVSTSQLCPTLWGVSCVAHSSMWWPPVQVLWTAWAWGTTGKLPSCASAWWRCEGWPNTASHP